jgi:hypothetical protein
MLLRTIILGCGLAAFAAGAVDAKCTVNIGHRVPGNQIGLAQKLAKKSSYESMRNGWRNGTCVITATLHPGGEPCTVNGTTYHVNVTRKGKTYHIFNELTQAGWYCSTR